MKLQSAKENVGFRQYFLWHFSCEVVCYICKQSVFLHGKQTTGSESVKLNSACLAEGVCNQMQHVCFKKCLALLQQCRFQ